MEIFIIILCSFLVLISGASEGIMDTVQFHFDRSRFSKFKNQSFWDPRISWKNKWKGGNPSLGEKFKFSSTFFVGITDAWHLFKTIRNLTLFISLPISAFFISDPFLLIVLIVSLRVMYGIGFRITYQ